MGDREKREKTGNKEKQKKIRYRNWIKQEFAQENDKGIYIINQTYFILI